MCRDTAIELKSSDLLVVELVSSLRAEMSALLCTVNWLSFAPKLQKLPASYVSIPHIAHADLYVSTQTFPTEIQPWQYS
jgi:hypothetical protein